MNGTARSRGYADPIIAGVGLGVVLFGTIMLTGRGLGASGAFVPGEDSQPWLIVELLAVALGAWLSARFAGRTGTARSAGEVDPTVPRIPRAVAGGVLMGVGARLAHGCTSGLGLTGGALLATGAWLFIPIAFASAAVVAYFVRRGVITS